MKINVTNLEAIAKTIKKVEGKATARTINVNDITETVQLIENKLSTLLPKKDWNGITVACDPNAQNFPGAYKYDPSSTTFILVRGSSSWFVTSMGRGFCHSETKKFVINMSDEKKMIAANYSIQYKNW